MIRKKKKWRWMSARHVIVKEFNALLDDVDRLLIKQNVLQCEKLLQQSYSKYHMLLQNELLSFYHCEKSNYTAIYTIILNKLSLFIYAINNRLGDLAHGCKWLSEAIQYTVTILQTLSQKNNRKRNGYSNKNIYEYYIFFRQMNPFQRRKTLQMYQRTFLSFDFVFHNEFFENGRLLDELQTQYPSVHPYTMCELLLQLAVLSNFLNQDLQYMHDFIFDNETAHAKEEGKRKIKVDAVIQKLDIRTSAGALKEFMNQLNFLEESTERLLRGIVPSEKCFILNLIEKKKTKTKRACCIENLLRYRSECYEDIEGQLNTFIFPTIKFTYSPSNVHNPYLTTRDLYESVAQLIGMFTATTS